VRFKSITIENFGPFKDRETIDFTDENGVIIIWGDNGRGKTSLLNAFNFAFFGIVKDRQGKTDNYIQFINQEGFSEGRYFFKVTLTIKDEDNTYIIHRGCSPKAGVKQPQTNEDLIVTLGVNKNGAILDGDTSAHVVNSLMPKDVARFFLFDGELLQEYEDLLDDTSVSGGRIMRAIEQILGLPVLSNGAKDANQVLLRYEAEASKVEQNDSKTSKFGAQKQRAIENKKLHEDEVTSLESKLDECLAKKRTLEAEMLETKQLRELSEKKRDIETRIEALEEEIDNRKEEIVQILKDSWRWMVAAPVNSEISRIQGGVTELERKKAEGAATASIVEMLRETITSAKCPVCDHSKGNEELDALSVKLNALIDGTCGLTHAEKEALETDKVRMSILRGLKLGTDKSDDLRQRCAALDDRKVKLADLKENQLAEVKVALSSFKDDKGDPFAIVADLTTCEKEIATIKEGIEKEKDIAKQQADIISQLTKTISTLSQNKDIDLAHKCVGLVSGIASIFSEAIDDYREKLKREVEADATELFLTMSTEDDYDSLRINKNYGLTIMRNGQAVPNRSAGWEHMVAFALIGALHKNAPLEGPVIMDSPFGRISTKNKGSMVKAIPLLSDQVVLLALPGEIDEGRARTDLGPTIVKERVLARVNAIHTKIEDLDS